MNEIIATIDARKAEEAVADCETDCANSNTEHELSSPERTDVVTDIVDDDTTN